MNKITYKSPTHQSLPIYSCNVFMNIRNSCFRLCLRWGDLEGYFGARYYDSRFGIWLSPDDPLADEYPSSSPYVYCGNNPVGNKDPNGMNYNPIYSWDGTFMGPDSWGLQGTPIFMNSSDYYVGIPHEDALRLGTRFGDVPLATHFAILNSVKAHSATLSSRPDWDGVVTIEEGISWALQHPNAWTNPTADNSLFVNTALLDFGSLSTSDFNNVEEVKPVNL